MNKIIAPEIIVPNSLGDLDGIAWVNGRYMKWRNIKLHAMAHGLHYGSAVFDGIRVYNGKPFQLSEHIARFREGAKALLMPLDHTQDELEQASRRVVSKRKITTGYIRLIAWRGAGPLDFNPKPNPPNVAIFAFSLEVFIPAGAKLLLSEWKRPAPDTGPWETKASGNYLPATLQKARAVDFQHHDALFLDWKGNIADTTGANIFLVFKDQLHTPKSNGFFTGLTRKTVISLAKQAGIATTIRHIPVRDIHKADAVFLTGSAAGIVPVGSVTLNADTQIAFYPKSTITSLLQQKYATLAGGN